MFVYSFGLWSIGSLYLQSETFTYIVSSYEQLSSVELGYG